MGQLVGDLWKVCGASSFIPHGGLILLLYMIFVEIQDAILNKMALKDNDPLVNYERSILKKNFDSSRLQQ